MIIPKINNIDILLYQKNGLCNFRLIVNIIDSGISNNKKSKITTKVKGNNAKKYISYFFSLHFINLFIINKFITIKVNGTILVKYILDW